MIRPQRRGPAASISHAPVHAPGAGSGDMLYNALFSKVILLHEAFCH